MQLEGPAEARVPLVGLVTGEDVRLLEVPAALEPRLRHYIGSIAFDSSSGCIAATAPKGGLVAFFADDGRYLDSIELPNGCGVAATGERGGFLLTSGLGALVEVSLLGRSATMTRHSRAAGTLFDNHAVLA